MPAVLVLRACAPTQSWGAVDNIGDNRPTNPWPLHASITGLLCQAAGIDDADTERIGRVSDAVQIVRVEAPGLVTSDFQTVSGTIDTNLRPRGTIVTRRGEIQDGCFTVFREYQDTVLARDLYRALRAPRQALFLGRRCHPVSAPFHTGLVDPSGVDDALVGGWETCRLHASSGDSWQIIERTTAPLNEPGVSLTDSVTVSLRPRRYRVAAVAARAIPRREPAPAHGPRLAITGEGTLIDLDREQP